MVDVPVELACARKNDIPAAAYIRERRHLYQHMAQRLDMLVLDGSLDLAELRTRVHLEVLRCIVPDSGRLGSSIADREPEAELSITDPPEQS
jgi:hypothetical protein